MFNSNIEKGGTGMTQAIEKSGTGVTQAIEKGGTGLNQMIEKSGTGIRRSVFLISLLTLLSLVNSPVSAAPDVNIVKQGDSVAISFVDGKQHLLGVGTEKDGYLIVPIHVIKSEGGGTGYRTKSEGGGTGYRTNSEGGGTGAKSEGGGTGYRTNSEGGGTGAKSEGGGTGNRTASEGGGTGAKSEGGGTGDRALSEGGGTGAKSEGGGTGHKAAELFGYAEIVLHGDTASVLVYRDNGRGGLIETAALELPVFEQ